MPALLEISVVPIGKASSSLGDTVVETLKVLEAEGVTYELGPMSTSLEGDLDTLFRIARRMHEACFKMGYPRVITTLRLDDRRDKELTLHYRVESVKRKLAEQAMHIRES